MAKPQKDILETDFEGMTRRDEDRFRDNKCYTKAQAAGETTFTVRERDYSAPLTVLAWIQLNFTTAPREKLIDAFERALYMRDSPRSKKVAD
jgi:hypothetical protein